MQSMNSQMIVDSKVLPLADEKCVIAEQGANAMVLLGLVSLRRRLDGPPKKRQRTCAAPTKLGCSESVPPSSLTGFTKKRRRVQIQEPAVNLTVPPSGHPVLDDKLNLWYSKEDFRVTLLFMRRACKHQLDPPNDQLPLYGETLAATYLACCVDSDSSTDEIPRSITPSQLQLLGTSGGDHRGMEACALLDLAAERSQKRRAIIQGIVSFGKSMSGYSGHEEVVRSIYEQMTLPSRKFAQTLGISDTLSALATYSEDELTSVTPQKVEGAPTPAEK
jgi:hypothetical protein